MEATRFDSIPFNVIVEGNIGCGKTTFLKHFKKFKSICTLAEPLHMWRNVGGSNLFALMYEDAKRWAFSFQSYVVLTMVEQHIKPTDCCIKLMERSIFSARNCFIEKMAKDGIIQPLSVIVIDEWIKWFTQNCDVGIDLIVYLRSSPEIVYERMLSRNRSEEKSVSLEYLQEVHEYHENWLYRQTMGPLPGPVLILDADLDEMNMIKEYERCETIIFEKTKTASIT